MSKQIVLHASLYSCRDDCCPLELIRCAGLRSHLTCSPQVTKLISRVQLSAPGEPSRDFLIQGPKEHGIPGLVNLFGIESPGLTSSLAIGQHVADMLLNPAALAGTKGPEGSGDKPAQAFID